jgi:hypothetical protein
LDVGALTSPTLAVGELHAHRRVMTHEHESPDRQHPDVIEERTHRVTLVAGIASLIAGVILICPLAADATAGPSPEWFKPPMPCVAVRARVANWTGFCKSPVVRRYAAAGSHAVAA